MPITLQRQKFDYITNNDIIKLIEEKFVLTGDIDAQKLIKYYPKENDNDEDIMVIDYNYNDKTIMATLENLRKKILVSLFKDFIKRNFSNSIDATIVFHGDWALPLYLNSDNYFNIINYDDPLDVLLPISFGGITSFELAISIVEVNDGKSIMRFTDDDIVDVYSDIIIAKPINFPTYDNLDDCIIEYNYFNHNSNKDRYRLNKVVRVTNDKVYFYDEQGELLTDG